MKKFEKNISDRKVLVDRLKELTGQDSFYTRVPRCAYEVGNFTVEKDGVLTVAEGADEAVIQTLKDEGLIGAEIPMPQITVIPATRAPGTVDAPVSNETEEHDPVPDSEYEQEAEEESAVSLGVRNADEVEETDEVEPLPDTEEEKAFPMDASISLPLTNHTVTTLKNLICLVYARGEQISKATGGEFLIEKDLVDTLLDEAAVHTVDQLKTFLKDYEQEHGDPMLGFHIGEDRITFDGFTDVPDADHLETYKRLAVAMNKMALTQKRIQAKDVNTANEKYALRIWLIRLGFNGDDYKHDRKILMEKLSGHTAFRTQAEAERAKEKAIKKRDALRAAKAAAQPGEV